MPTAKRKTPTETAKGNATAKGKTISKTANTKETSKTVKGQATSRITKSKATVNTTKAKATTGERKRQVTTKKRELRPRFPTIETQDLQPSSPVELVKSFDNVLGGEKGPPRPGKRARSNGHSDRPGRKKFKPSPMSNLENMYRGLNVGSASNGDNGREETETQEAGPSGAAEIPTLGPQAGGRGGGGYGRGRGGGAGYAKRASGSQGPWRFFRWPYDGAWHFRLFSGWSDTQFWILNWDRDVWGSAGNRSVIKPGIILKAPYVADHWDQRHDQSISGNFNFRRFPTPLGYVSSKLRFYIVLDCFRSTYVCLPLFTYNNRPIEEVPSHDVKEHITVRDHRLHRPDGPWANQWPGYIQVQGDHEPLDTEYIASVHTNYLRPCTVVKLTDVVSRGFDWPADIFGYITEDSYRRLYKAFKELWCGRSPKRPENDQYKLPSDDKDDAMLLPPPESWPSEGACSAQYRSNSGDRSEPEAWTPPSHAGSWRPQGGRRDGSVRLGGQVPPGTPTGPAAGTRSRTQHLRFQTPESYNPPSRGRGGGFHSGTNTPGRGRGRGYSSGINTPRGRRGGPLASGPWRGGQ